MSEYPNSGILFPNFRKNSPKHPDYQGTGTIDGKPKRISAWKRTGKKGEFLTLAFQDPKPSSELPQAEPAASIPATEAAATEAKQDDIPF